MDVSSHVERYVVCGAKSRAKGFGKNVVDIVCHEAGGAEKVVVEEAARKSERVQIELQGAEYTPN